MRAIPFERIEKPLAFGIAMRHDDFQLGIVIKVSDGDGAHVPACVADLKGRESGRAAGKNSEQRGDANEQIVFYHANEMENAAEIAADSSY